MPPKRFNPFRIPDSLLSDPILSEVIENCLPKNYNFEVHKTVWRIRCLKAKCVALQMPEGLLRFATILSEIFKRFGTTKYEIVRDGERETPPDVEDSDIDIIILGDVSYGACCIDDFSATALNADLLVHYGHSCLIPLESPFVLYVFVDIQFDMAHFIESVRTNFPSNTRIALLSTIQFVTSLPPIKKALESASTIENKPAKSFKVTIPQAMPLSPGEVLGCTSPKVKDVDLLLFIGDGRFHLESAMLAHPKLPAYLYDPYSKTMTLEKYDHEMMRITRLRAIEAAVKAKSFGIILGTLGRQGCPPVVQLLEKRLAALNRTSFIILLSEIFPSKLALFEDQVDVWIQVACPRLSIDWGIEFPKPLLTPYEASVALGLAETTVWTDTEPYPTDYYAYDSLGPWTPNHLDNRPQLLLRKKETAVNLQDTCDRNCVCDSK